MTERDEYTPSVDRAADLYVRAREQPAHAAEHLPAKYPDEYRAEFDRMIEAVRAEAIREWLDRKAKVIERRAKVIERHDFVMPDDTPSDDEHRQSREVAAVVAAWRESRSGLPLGALEEALDRLAEAHGEVVPDGHDAR